MTDTALPGDGDLELVLPREPKPVILKCNAAAAIRLSRLPGAFENADPHVSTVTSRVLGLHIDTMAEVIRAGAGVGPSAVPDLGEKIYEAGLYEVMVVLAQYLGRLKNGGQPFAPQKEVADDGAEDPPNLSA